MEFYLLSRKIYLLLQFFCYNNLYFTTPIIGIVPGMFFSKKEREFKAMYNDLYPLIVNTLYNRVRNMEDAEDICHEIFVSYYNKYDGIVDARSWLFGAIKYSVSNYYRRKKSAGAESVDLDAIEDSIHVAYENGFRDTRIILYQAIENDENYRDRTERALFDLIAINKYTFENAARHLGLTKRQAVYKYEQVSRRILQYLKDRGISTIEDLL